MSGFCSAHKHYEYGCKQCEMTFMILNKDAQNTDKPVITDKNKIPIVIDKVYLAELENILIRMALDMKDLDPEYSKVCDKHFWSLI